MAKEVQTLSGQPVVIDNKPGALGQIGMQSLVGTSKDGHDLIAMPLSFVVIVPQLGASRIDPMTAFKPVCQYGQTQPFLFVSNHVKAHTFREFVELAKAKPGALKYASTGAGSQIHLTSEILQRNLGIKLTHVPYKGAADSVSDLLSGRIEVMFDPTLLPLARQDKVRLLATLGSKPVPGFPNVPTAAQLGLEPAIAWFGLFALAEVPSAVVERASALCEKVANAKAVVDLMATFVVWPAYATPKVFAETIQRDYKVFGDIIRTNNIKSE
jgi:tripartite-type tricarboxylate transporter receptor subunit TctC